MIGEKKHKFIGFKRLFLFYCHKLGHYQLVCALKNFGKIKKNDFGVFIEYKNNFGHEGGCLMEWDTRHQCSYEDEGAFDDTTVYHKVCVFEDIFVYDNALIYGCLGGQEFACL
ncbi:hypothetical protein [Bartonella sp. AU55XJBT]|uniref:hypothetical protein n=1 Tax=Bartonella sp. AU55XJBT TaxID=3019091 RepID=UPI002362A648|nr:hypothetical protein [Bartonella sp. AU55XJBT]